MKKNSNAIYAPGELGRVREKLGDVDDTEALRVARLLGGEVGTERGEESNAAKTKKPRGTVELAPDGRRSGRMIDIALDDEDNKRNRSAFKMDEPYPGDDPSVTRSLSYIERVKMDQFAGQITFEIKNSAQVLVSVFSFFKEPIDYINPHFVTKRMNEYFDRIQRMVNAARNLFPQNNTKRNNQLKRASPFVYRILDVIRNWNVEVIASNIAGLQAHPRVVRATDFVDILQAVYKPLFILDELSTENIKNAFKLIYKVLYIESPMDAKEKYQDVIRNIIALLVSTRKNVQYGLYPILMKLISDRFIPYERFFIERRRRYMAFLNVSERDQLAASDMHLQQIENMDVQSLQENLKEEPPPETNDGNANAEISENAPEENPTDPRVVAKRAEEDAEKAEHKALEQGRTTLESLFPQAGWDKLGEFPDLYPYFADAYSMKRGYELLAPSDPLQQVSVLMHILEDIFYAMRYVKFGTVTSHDTGSMNITDDLDEIVNNWQKYIDDSFMKEYLPRLTEYCRLLENAPEARISPYAKKTMNELHWIKRLYFLPYYHFESLGPPPFQKRDVIPIYSQVRKLRIHFTSIAMGIEQGFHSGGATAKAQCEGIRNPWEPYKFEVPNTVSRRLSMLLTPEKKINASLIFFSLSAIAVLDYIVNNENSWAYPDRSGPLFRSIRDEGIMPVFGVDKKLDIERIFRNSLKKE